jgi:hypothetical protein
MSDELTEEDVRSALRQGTVSAAEHGQVPESGATHGSCDVIVGELPAAEDPSVMVWTARCTDDDHGLLGHFQTREEAEDAKAHHLHADHKEAS